MFLAGLRVLSLESRRAAEMASFALAEDQAL
jgi:hypothetical protein